jgi:hypothetical protein
MHSSRVLLAVLVACCWSIQAGCFTSAFVIPKVVIGGSSAAAATVFSCRGCCAASSTQRWASATAATNKEFALLFDCDGVILETEEYHRLAYNEAFRKFQLTIDGQPVEWSVRKSVCLTLRVCVLV